MYKYDAFGRKYFESGPPLVDEFAYTARQRHDRTGLYYYLNRFYYPQLGRFMTQDPIGITGGTNLYAYVGNSPVNYIDPLGLSSIVFDRSDSKIYVYPGTEETHGPPQAFTAHNRARNPDANPFKPDGYGPAPNGTFPMKPFTRTYGGPNSSYGYGFVGIILPETELGLREGVGVHGGRANQGGPRHGTLGCIRSTDDAMSVLENDPPTGITIQE